MAKDLEIGEDDQTEQTHSSDQDTKLFTQSYDLSISTLAEQWEDKTLVLPDIQRQYVWDNARASRLIESLLLNIPIPVVYFSETQELNYLVIDGHQRIRSIVRFLNGEFALSGLKVLTDFNRKRFHQLPEKYQKRIRTRVIRAIIIGADSDPMMQFEVFERLNTGSIALNAQEVRNSTHRGPMNDQIMQLVTYPNFRACVGSKSPRSRMVDNELILRFLALHNGWTEYRPPLSRYLNNFMKVGNAYSEAELEESAVAFRKASDGVLKVLGAGAFRVLNLSGAPLDRNVNRALAETQLTSFSWVQDISLLSERKHTMIEEISLLMQNTDFQDAIQRATGDRSRTLRRLGMFCEALTRAGVNVEQQVQYEPLS